MVAGESARDQAERAAAAAAHLERKAEGARRRAEAFAKGAEGEAALAAALAPLTAEGWFFLHDRVMPTGGNIDHVGIGPGGVVVFDAKAWSGQVQVRDGRLRVGSRAQDKAVDGVLGQVAAVRAVVGTDVTVVPCLVITEQGTLEVERVSGVGVVGLDEVAAVVRELPPNLATVEVERLLRLVSEAFPPVEGAPAAALGMVEVEPVEEWKSLFLKANRFVYLTTWKKGGRHRIYAKDDAGAELGWKDVISGEVHLAGPHPFAEVILTAVTPTGLPLDRRAIPRIPFDIRGGRLIGALTKLYMSALVGQRWEKGGKRRLYGTLVSPSDGVIRLGYVDLETGYVRPDIEGPINDSRPSADLYLGFLRDRMPGRERTLAGGDAGQQG